MISRSSPEGQSRDWRHVGRADSPMNLPDHRRPAEVRRHRQDPVWGVIIESLGVNVIFRQDKPTHGLFEPAREMPIEEFQKSLADLAPKWFKL